MSTIGQHLKKAREEKKISAENLSEITRINLRIIKSIEEDNFSELPKLPYLQCFTRSIASVLELDQEMAEELLVKTYDEKLHVIVKTERVPKFESFRKLYMMDSLVALGLIKYVCNSLVMKVMVFLALITSLLFGGYSYVASYRTTVSEVVDSPRAIPAIHSLQKKYKIVLIASKNSSWVTFKVDKDPARHRLLKKGENMSMEVNNGSIILGNPKSTHLYVNGNEIDTQLHSKRSGIAKIEFSESEPFIKTKIARSLAFEKYR